MSWLSKVRAKSRAEKIKLIWIITSIVFVLLILLWILAGKYNNPKGEDLNLVNQLDDIIQNTKDNAPDLTPNSN